MCRGKASRQWCLGRVNFVIGGGGFGPVSRGRCINA